ncbi:MAG: hypothetical protein JFT11_10230 [Muribaculaceae bacterium]|mgnify:CR=1 FL=1|jgi:hypothetical protein|nr:hypothetical protein [Muribaculaceae bacterium]
MKKLFLSFAVIAGLSMISCGNKAENTEVAADAVDTVEVVEAAVVEEVPADSAAVDTVVAVVEEAAAATAE